MTLAAQTANACILVVDDEAPLRFAVAEVLTEAGYRVLEANGVRSALPLVQEADVIISDLSMPDLSGLDLLDALKQQGSDTPLIILTARGSERSAVAAMKRGAWDYLSKPFDNEELKLSVQRALERSRLASSHKRRAAQNHTGQWVVGESPVFLQLLSTVERVAQRNVTVLLQGETGTGKEGIASLLHAHSARRERALVRFNCAAISETLAAAELFGHEKGAFTGATQRRDGFFKRAHGGTLVLDEVAELPASVQGALLRALQEGEVQPVGSSRVETVDVRVVACSAASLEERVKAGRFRADLYYRLKVVELRVPSLRERVSDVPLLVRHFQLKHAERFGLSDVPLPTLLVKHLTQRAWPGNIRELENTVAHVLALSDDGHVSEAQLTELLTNQAALDFLTTPELDAQVRPLSAQANENTSLRERLDAYERALISAAWTASGNNQSQAARLLGTTRTTLIDKMKRLGIH